MADESSEVGWQTPRSWLYAWDFARDCGRFLTLDRETLARSSFLDQRIETDTANYDEVPVPELLGQTVRGSAGAPAGYIFHTAFCCSTLLARSLDIAGRTLVLREPATLLQLADLKRGLSASRRPKSELLPLTLALLARSFDPGERVIVKPTNVVNNLAAELLAAHSNTHALVLYDDLEPFLLAVLKRPRESARGIAEFLRRLCADPVGRDWAAAHAIPESLTARATLVWMLQIHGLQAGLANENHDRVRILRTTELLDAPAQALAASAAWLGVKLTEAEAGKIASGPLWNRHAKHPETPYTLDRRREEQALARRILAEPVREGMAWAAKNGCTSDAGFPRELNLLA
ncbi:MAG: hypothetical protein ACRESR_01230 [Gammaproteobacteria bacterium]